MNARNDSRRATVRLSIAGSDASSAIAPSLISFTWTDQASDKADGLCVSLADRDRLWQGAWMPRKGDPLTASLVVADWFAPGDNFTLPCGAFEVDEIECSGPPDVIRIKGVSTPVSGALRREKKTQSFENTTLAAIAAQVAAGGGLSPLYQAPAIRIPRVDQREESDLAFLRRQAAKYGLNLKISDSQLIIFSGRQYDSKPPVATLRRGESWISRHSFRTQAHEQFKDCEVSYWEPEKKEQLTQTFRAPGKPPSGQTLKINERMTSLDEARTVAQHRLRQKNKHEVEGSLDLAGDPRLLAGCTATVQGYGAYDGTYFIEQATHSVSRGGGYTSRISIRKTLEY